MKRFRTAIVATHAGALLLGGMLAGCGKKGPPLAPLQLLPARIQDVRATRQADSVRIAFTLPNKNEDGTTPADIAYVLVYGLTGEPVGPAGRPLDVEEWERFGALVGRIDVAPPPPPVEEDEETEADDKEQQRRAAERAALERGETRPKQGESVSVTETLDSRVQTRFVHPDVAAADAEGDTAQGDAASPGTAAASSEVTVDDASGFSVRTVVPAADVLPRRTLLERVYVVIPFARGDRVAAISNPASIPLAATPPAPSAPQVTYTAEAFTLKWQPPAGIRMPIQRPVTEARQAEGWLRARPALPGVPPHAFAIYELPGPDAEPSEARLVTAVPISPTDPEFTDRRVQFGEQRCYAVRTIQAFPSGTLESPLSPAGCATPQDTFAPAAPGNLSSVGSEGGVSLIWEPNTEPDLAGYLVLRGEQSQPLEPITARPIKETTYRDTAVQANVVYVYAVVAIDGNGNRSAESNRVEDMAQ